MADIAASILARLKNKAKEKRITFQQTLQLFVQEEFLRRLSLSEYAENMVLKGGLFIYAITNFESRPTVDVDFLLRKHTNDIADIKSMIEKILMTDSGNDYIVMTAQNFEEITPLRKYKGVRVQVIAKIKNVRIPFDVDIGVGDVIVPGVEYHQIKPQLNGFKSSQVATYSLESAIAEKFDAILQRFELTSRMKDFYDIYYLAKTFSFDGFMLQTAIAQTLQNRKTSYEKAGFERISELPNDPDMQKKWRHFIKKIADTNIEFTDVISEIEKFLQPIFIAITEGEEFSGHWESEKRAWQGT